MRGIKVYLTDSIPREARAWRNDYAIWRWCRQYTLIDEESHKRWLERISEDPSIKMFGVRLLKDDSPVGVCGLTSIDRVNQSAEFSLYIARHGQSLGYGKDALNTLLHHAFYDQNLNRVWGETYDGNPALDLFYKVGMKLEGTKKKAYFREGKFIDCHMVAILREDFRL